MEDVSAGPVRFTLEIVPGATLPFIRYPVSTTPAEGTAALVTGEAWQTVGIFKRGEWRNRSGKAFARPVRFWTTLDRDTFERSSA